MSDERSQKDIAALAKGGRTNFIGFLLRLAARVPFLFIAGRLYGPDALGRFAFALLAVEFASQIAALGQKRGLAQQLSRAEQPDSHIVADAMFLSLITSTVLMLFLIAFPLLMFPSGQFSRLDMLLPLAVIPFTLTDIALSAQAYRYDVATTVRARAVVEPWVLSIVAAVAFFMVPDSGLAVAYIASVFAAAIAALIPVLRTYGVPRGWSPQPTRILRLAWGNIPLAAADAIEWSSRRLDLAILGLFASPSAVGIYWAAQQVASLPSKLKTSFEPILGPVITRSLKDKDYAAIAKQVCQVGFWITAMQAGVALALGIPGEAVMGLVGPEFVGGNGALIFLLVAEVVAATAVVSEAALIYVARMKNLWVSICTITLQAALTVGFMIELNRLGLPELYYAASAALALMLSLAVSSIVKALLLSRFLGEPVNNWRWALIWAAAPAAIVGWVATQLPEWAELIIGAPAILFVYCFVIWRKGFGPDDRMLFRKSIGPKDPDEAAENT